MNMTHYMGLLADNQPWNLIIFMAIPVICAETIAVTELAILFTRNLNGKLRLVNKITTIFVGIIYWYSYLFAVQCCYSDHFKRRMARVDRCCSRRVLLIRNHSIAWDGSFRIKYFI